MQGGSTAMSEPLRNGGNRGVEDDSASLPTFRSSGTAAWGRSGILLPASATLSRLERQRRQWARCSRTTSQAGAGSLPLLKATRSSWVGQGVLGGLWSDPISGPLPAGVVGPPIEQCRRGESLVEP